MNIERRWKERGETLGPALLAVLALVLDLAEEGESSVHAVAVGVIGSTRLARRFARWRALGLLAAAFCLGLALVERLSAPRLVPDATLYLSILGGAWALLTGWVWGRRSWERLASGLPESPGEQPVRWTGREIGEA